MTDAELIHDLQEVHYTVATQRTTIEDLVVEKEEQEGHIEKLRGIVREGLLDGIRLMDSRNAWRRVATGLAIANAILLIGIFTR